MSRSGRPAKREMKKFEMPFDIWFLRGAPARRELADAEDEARSGSLGGEQHAARLVRGVLSVGVDGERDLVTARPRRGEPGDERRALAAVLAVRDELAARARRDLRGAVASSRRRRRGSRRRAPGIARAAPR